MVRFVARYPAILGYAAAAAIFAPLIGWARSSAIGLVALAVVVAALILCAVGWRIAFGIWPGDDL
jgi:hypothetical protein